MKRLLLALSLFGTVTVPSAWASTVPAAAGGIIVTTADNELNADGDCSLREAVQAANTDTAVDLCVPGIGADTISFLATLAGATIPLAVLFGIIR